MKQTDKIRVAVLYGGRSSEHEVSIKSAANVIRHLDPKRFDVIPIGIDKKGKWLMGKDIFSQSLSCNQVKALPSDTWFTPEWVGKPFAKQEAQAVIKANSEQPVIDVIFPVVHGVLCEDGTLQGLLELANVPYVGCGVLASAIGMDKDVSKRLAQLAGITVPPHFVVKETVWKESSGSIVAKVLELGYPVFVKPANTGSSIGISKVKHEKDLRQAVELAFTIDNKILIEKALNIQELEVAVLESLDENVEPIVSVVGEIKPSHEFYSYEAKYLDEHGAALVIPAQLSAEVALQVQKIAKDLFKILECEGMARVDLFLDMDSQEIVFNEINTLPGFTEISMYPKLMHASGMEYSELLSHLIDLAIKRFKVKNQLIRSYTT
ncbi:MAG: D-alanine--D-alanine ligase [Gammaproteobacteria bacterium]|nr:D-alanine--D-alanine ligase [Gammaproteobacteria bacterium]